MKERFECNSPHKQTPAQIVRPMTGTATGGSSSTSAVNHLKQRVERIEADTKEIEKQVYDLETSYLTDHSANGNVLKGFESALAQTKSATQKKVKPFKVDERLFSISSATSQVNEEIAAEAEAVRTTASGRLAKPPSTFGAR